MKEKRIITILMVFTIIFTFFGASLAYWNWETSEAQRTSVVFTVEKEFQCAADGGGNITSEQVSLVPTDCTNETYAIQRTVTVSPTLYRNDLSVYMDLWLQINNIGSGLSNSQNFRYALTTSPTSCTTGVISEGNFNGKTNVDGNNTVQILAKSYTGTLTEKYYLYIWLDKAETSSSTMNQLFDLSLNGNCTNDPYIPPEEPVLDEGMIPVTISEDGVATTVSEDDSSWYNYENKEWANVVLVKEEGTQKRSYYKNNTGKTVNENDILAYYVWIPRYKYRIPEMTCSELDNPTVERYPECYLYSMTEDDKEILANWLLGKFPVYISGYTLEAAREDVEEGLKTGIIVAVQNGYTISYSVSEAISLCNSNNEHSITYSSEFVANNVLLSTTARPIDIAFETTTSTVINGDAVTTFRTHPAFIWDGETVAGIWVGKFEIGHATLTSSTTSNNLSCTDENCTNADGLIIKPNVQSLRWNDVSNFFYASRSMTRSTNPFGLNALTTDTHMMKNSEWGAVAYLSHSKYGINSEIYINNSEDYYTGRSGGNVGGSVDTVATHYSGQTDTSDYISKGYYTWTGQEIDASGTIGSYASDRTLGTKASTTGNVTGVYDMSGGAWEYVMGNYGNTISYSGFTILPDSKYYDVYSSAQFTGDYITNMGLCTLETCGGHALNETEYWYGDNAYFVDSTGPWFCRGGNYNNGTNAGAFSLGISYGVDSTDACFRSSALVKES